MSWLHPTVRITDLAGRPRLIAIQAVRESIPGSGIMDEAKYHIYGCEASPMWVKVSSLRPLMENAEILE